jgi:peptide deformylase
MEEILAIRNIRLSGDEILAKTSRKVDKVDDRIKMILEDMADTMYAANGLGLAAVQVGVLRRLVVIDVGEGLLKLVNPEITYREGEETDIEGCLSVPGYQGNGKRPVKGRMRALDENGGKIEIEAEGLMKKAICHELDHLDGIMYTDIAENLVEISQLEDEEGADGADGGSGEKTEQA